MTYSIGSALATQTLQAIDKASADNSIKSLCGALVFSTGLSASFMRLNSAIGLIEVASTNKEDAGIFSVSIKVSLANYPMVQSASAEIKLTMIGPKISGNLPYFDPKLPQVLTIQQKKESESWKYLLPRIKDADQDPVKLTVNFGAAASFLKLNDQASIEILDTSACRAGIYFLYFTLSDDPNQVVDPNKVTPTFNMMFIIYPPPKEEAPQKAQEPLPEQEASTEKDESTSEEALAEEDESSDLPATSDPSSKSTGLLTSNQGSSSIKPGDAQKKEKPIVLKPQARDVLVPDYVLEYMETLIQQSDSMGRAKDQIKAAQTECVPAGFEELPVVDGTASFNLKFLHSVTLRSQEGLIQQIKKTQSIQMQLLKADPSKPASEMDWDIRIESEKKIQLSINFTDPENISASSLGQDRLRVVFKDASAFISCPSLSPSGRLLKQMPKDTILMIPLPSLFSTEVTKATEELVQALDTPQSKAMLLSSFLIQYLVGLSVNLLWGGVNSLQIVGILSIYDVFVPPNSKKLVSFVQTLVTFDMFYDIYDPNENIPFSETPAYSDNFCAVKYCSLGYFDALGSVAVILVLTTLTWLSVPSIRSIAAKTRWDQWKCCKSVRERQGLFNLNKVQVSNALIRLTLEQFITYLIAGFLTLYAPRAIEESGGKPNAYDKVNFWFGYFTLGVSAIFTVIVVTATFVNYFRVSKKAELERSIADSQSLIVCIGNYLGKEEKKEQGAPLAQEENKEEPVLEQSPEASDENINAQFLARPQEIRVSEEDETDRDMVFEADCTSRKVQFAFSKENANLSQISQLDKSENDGLHRSTRRVGLESFKDKADQLELSRFDAADARMGLTQPVFQLKGIGPSLLEVPDKRLGGLEEILSVSRSETAKENINRMEEEIPGEQPCFFTPVEQNHAAEEQKQEPGDKKDEASETIATDQLIAQLLLEEFQEGCDRRLELTSYEEKIKRTTLTREAISVRLEQLKSELRSKLEQRKAMDTQEEDKKHWLNVEHFSSLREDLNEDLPALFFHIQFLVRRVAVVSVAFTMKEMPIFQLIVFIFVGLSTMCYIAAVKPFENSSQNKTEIFNEFVILLMVDIYATLLGTTYDIQALTNFGHLLNAFIAMILIANFGIMVVEQIGLMVGKLKRLYAKCTRRGNVKPPRAESQSSLMIDPDKAIEMEEENKGEQNDQQNQSSELLLRKTPPAALAQAKHLEDEENREPTQRSIDTEQMIQDIERVIEKAKEDEVWLAN